MLSTILSIRAVFSVNGGDQQEKSELNEDRNKLQLPNHDIEVPIRSRSRHVLTPPQRYHGILFNTASSTSPSVLNIKQKKTKGVQINLDICSLATGCIVWGKGGVTRVAMLKKESGSKKEGSVGSCNAPGQQNVQATGVCTFAQVGATNILYNCPIRDNNDYARSIFRGSSR